MGEGKKRDIYRAIMIAAAKGNGLHLTADEVFILSLDDAIMTRAQNSVSTEELQGASDYNSFQWSIAKPYVTGAPSNLHVDDRWEP